GLKLMTNSLRAGHAFNAAMKAVGDEMGDPVGPEFNTTFEEQNLGLGLEEALHNLAGRIDSVDLRFFVTAVLIQRETGGNLAEIMDSLGDTIRERMRIKGQVKVLTAQGRFTGYILGFMPAGLGVGLYALNPDYMGPLITTTMGRIMLGAGMFMMLLGFIVMKKIVSIKI
ncbi:unnamed protein product, partial [marine sediment metagenome]